MYAVLDIAPPSVLKRPTDWPAIKVHTSAFPERPACFRGRVIILDFDHNALLETASPPVLKLKLPVDWPATKVPALSRSIYRLQCFRQSIPTGGRMATWLLVNRRIGRSPWCQKHASRRRESSPGHTGSPSSPLRPVHLPNRK
jgi:hypothetical protein